MIKHIMGATALALVLSGGAMAAGQQSEGAKMTPSGQQEGQAQQLPQEQMQGQQGQMQGQQDQMQGQQQASVLTSERLLDMKVQGPQGEEIGDVEQLIIDPQSGKIDGVVVSVGGFLGIGEKQVALPWQEMQLAQENLISPATKEELEQAQAWEDPNQQTAQTPQPQQGQGMPAQPPAEREPQPQAPAGAGQTR